MVSIVSNYVIVGHLPDCDLCKTLHGIIGPASVDGLTVFGPWANMCHECFSQYGVGIGTGQGQVLILKTVGTKGDSVPTP